MAGSDLMKLYLASGNLKVECYFLYGNNVKEEQNKTINLLISRGLTPSLTIKNSTYSGIFNFNLSKESNQSNWLVDIPREAVTLRRDIAPVEEWFVTISLQEGLETHTAEGTLLDLLREPILQWTLGKHMYMKGFYAVLNYVVDIKITRCPCANDVAIIGLICNSSLGGIYLGLTYSGFWDDNDTMWFNLTENICIYFDEDCLDASIVDIKLTNLHLAILTTVGLYISADLRYPKGILTFSRVNFCGFDTEDYISAKLWYNEICLANKEDFEEDYLSITFEKTRTMSQVATCFYSKHPFKTWTPCDPNYKRTRTKKSHFHLVSFLIDNEMNSAIYLYKTKSYNYVAVRTLQDHSPKDKLKFPRFFFPNDFYPATGMSFHPRTHFLYVFGNQVWLSFDGGNSFEIMGDFSNEIISESYHSFHSSDIIFASRTSKLYFTKAVTATLEDYLPRNRRIAVCIGGRVDYTDVIDNRFLELPGTQISKCIGILSYYRMGESKLQLFSIYYDQVGTRNIVSLSKSTTDGIDIFDLLSFEAIQESDEESNFHTAIAPQYLTSNELIFFAYVPMNTSEKDKKELMFNSRHIGRSLRLKSGGYADIVKTMHHEDIVGFPSSAKADLFLPFSIESKSPSLMSSITIQKDTGFLYKVILQAQPGNTILHFRDSDIEKTMVIPGYSSLLIVKILNDMNALALATMPDSVLLNENIPSKKWLLYNFGTKDHTRWSITPASCKYAIMHDDVKTAKSIVKYLDVGSSYKFKITTLSQVKEGVRLHKVPLLKIIVGHPFLIEIRTKTYWDQTDSYVVEIEAINRNLRKGVTSISFIVWKAEVLCKTSAIILTLKSSCSYAKVMSFIPEYHIPLDDWEQGLHKDKHGFNMIKTLPKNYRPPSNMGIGIPLTDNFYNADPSASRPRNYHPLSKATGKYKQCFNKSSRAECNCTAEQKFSQHIEFSDCKEKVINYLYPVYHYPISLRILSEDQTFQMEAPYFITISEVNNRKSWKLKQQVPKEMQKMKAYLEKMKFGSVYNPKGLNLSITGSELFHFRVKVIPGVSFCQLVEEFQIYVDNAPLPFPRRALVSSLTTVILGGIIFMVFMMELFDIHIWMPIKNIFIRKNKVKSSGSSININE